MKQTKYLLILFSLSLLLHTGFSQYIPFYQKGKWGFADTSGKLVIPCTYDTVDFFSDDKLARVRMAGRYGYINTKGEIVLPVAYDACWRVYDVFHGEHSVGLKRHPEIHINTEFDYSDVMNNRYILTKNGKSGIMKITAGKTETVVPFNYNYIMFDPGRKIYNCIGDSSVRYFTAEGKELTAQDVKKIEQIEYSTIMPPDFENMKGIIQQNQAGKYGMLRKAGGYSYENKYDTVLPFQYDEIITEKEDIFDNAIAVRIGNKWGMVKSGNKILLPVQYEAVNFSLSNENRHWAVIKRVFVAMKNKKWGMLGKKEDTDKTLIRLLPFSYNSISKIYYSYLVVEKEKAFQVYSLEKHKLVSSGSYYSVSPYEHESEGDYYLFLVTTRKGGPAYFLGQNGVAFFKE